MATVTLGSIKFNWKGAYNSSTAYAVDDVVSSGGNSYVCIQAHTNQAVGNATAYWNIMSAKGTDADLLNISSTAQGDIYYNNGGAIARLGAGTAGQALLSGGAGANPSWGSSGKIGAISHTLFKAQFTGAVQTTWTEISNYNCTITPTKAGSTILAMGHISTGSNAGGPAGHGLKLYRSVAGASNSSIDDWTGNADGNRIRSMVAGSSEFGSDWVQENGAFNVIDSSTTGLSYSAGQAIKYSMYQWNASSNGAVVVNRSQRNSNGNDDVVTTSSITLMEILA
jgi:hypothetical protein